MVTNKIIHTILLRKNTKHTHDAIWHAQKVRTRAVSWKVGTMTGKAMDIADVLRRRKLCTPVDVACVQEVERNDRKRGMWAMATNFFYHGDTGNRNGVWIILREERTKYVLENSRISDRIILLKLACPNTTNPTTYGSVGIIQWPTSPILM